MDVIIAFLQFLMMLVCLGMVGFYACLILIWRPLEKAYSELDRRYKGIIIDLEANRALHRMAQTVTNEAYEKLRVIGNPEKHTPEELAQARKEFYEIQIQIDHFSQRLNTSVNGFYKKLNMGK